MSHGTHVWGGATWQAEMRKSGRSGIGAAGAERGHVRGGGGATGAAGVTAAAGPSGGGRAAPRATLPGCGRRERGAAAGVRGGHRAGRKAQRWGSRATDCTGGSTGCSMKLWVSPSVALLSAVAAKKGQSGSPAKAAQRGGCQTAGCGESCRRFRTVGPAPWVLYCSFLVLGRCELEQRRQRPPSSLFAAASAAESWASRGPNHAT